MRQGRAPVEHVEEGDAEVGQQAKLGEEAAEVVAAVLEVREDLHDALEADEREEALGGRLAAPLAPALLRARHQLHQHGQTCGHKHT
jgi:hypothetical protein